MSYGPSRGSRGGGGRSSHPYSRGGDRRGDYEEEVIEISTNRLYVHNLSWRVSWQDLKDHFRQAGEVIHTKILTEGPGGRSKGCGIVEMDTVDSAANAVEMLNDTELRNPWQSMKTQRTMSMTVEAWDQLGNLASGSATSRSEVLEILIRSANRQGVDLVEERAALLVDKLI